MNRRDRAALSSLVRREVEAALERWFGAPKVSPPVAQPGVTPPEPVPPVARADGVSADIMRMVAEDADPNRTRRRRKAPK